MKREQTFALVASAMLTVLAGLSACSKEDDPVLPEDDTMETVGFATPHSLFHALIGDVVDTERNAYTVTEKQLLPWNVTPIGVLTYWEKSTAKNCYVGLIIALDDEPEEMDWETAKGPNGAAAHTPAIAGYEWRLPSSGDWSDMLWLKYRYDRYYCDVLNSYIKYYGGTALNGIYWSSTEHDKIYARTVKINPDKNEYRLENEVSFAVNYNKQTVKKVRACINIDLRYDIRPDEFVLSDSILSLTASSHTKSFTVTRPGEGKVTATSSDPKVASVTVTDATSETATVNVTAINDGLATITVKCGPTAMYNAYTANDKTVSVTASGIEPETLVELKAWVAAGHTANTYIGRYVNSKGELSKNPSDAIGIVAYYANSDVEIGISGIQNILVLSNKDVSTGATWGDMGATLYGYDDINAMNGYALTKSLHYIYSGSAAALVWNNWAQAIRGISGASYTQWFLPSYRQWTEIMGYMGIGRGINDRSVTGMSTSENIGYWSSTESSTKDCAWYLLNRNGRLYINDKNAKLLVRGVFAY